MRELCEVRGAEAMAAGNERFIRSENERLAKLVIRLRKTIATLKRRAADSNRKGTK